jgi:putative FmdB family regulatory protein
LALEEAECQPPEAAVPTYQYACTACGHQLEAVQSFADEQLTECPACQGKLRKLFSAVGIVFKGSGFYRTDSRSSSKSEATASPTASSATSSTNGGAEAPAAKPAESTKADKKAASTTTSSSS